MKKTIWLVFRAIDVLDFTTLKAIDVLALLGQRCLGTYQLIIRNSLWNEFPAPVYKNYIGAKKQTINASSYALFEEVENV